MKTRLTRKPGDKGTKRYSLQYGDKLVCVRDRYDEKKHKRYRTVELIVDEAEWIADDVLTLVRVDWGERDLGLLVKSAGGVWVREKRLWRLPYGEVRKLGLEERLVRDW